jgi:transcription elongation factor Elf1
MGGRKRKKVIKRVKKTIPKVFACPNCGEKTLSVFINREEGKATIKCGRCNIIDEIPLAGVEEAVDAYGKFVDRYYGYKSESSGVSDEKN